MHLRIPAKAVFSGLGLWAFTSRYKLGTLIMRFDVRRYSLVSLDIILLSNKSSTKSSTNVHVSDVQS